MRTLNLPFATALRGSSSAFLALALIAGCGVETGKSPIGSSRSALSHEQADKNEIQGDNDDGEHDDSGITIISATYGLNCGVPAGQHTAAIAAACNGLQSCDYTVSWRVLGDPAWLCVKQFTVTYSCDGNDPTTITTPPGIEAGYGTVVHLTCPTDN